MIQPFHGRLAYLSAIMALITSKQFLGKDAHMGKENGGFDRFKTAKGCY